MKELMLHVIEFALDEVSKSHGLEDLPLREEERETLKKSFSENCDPDMWTQEEHLWDSIDRMLYDIERGRRV